MNGVANEELELNESDISEDEEEEEAILNIHERLQGAKNQIREMVDADKAMIERLKNYDAGFSSLTSSVEEKKLDVDDGEKQSEKQSEKQTVEEF